MYIKPYAKCTNLQHKVGYAAKTVAFKVRHLKLLKLIFDQTLRFLLKPKKYFTYLNITQSDENFVAYCHFHCSKRISQQHTECTLQKQTKNYLHAI